MTLSFEIAGRPIGPGHPPYVIAELSGNHNGDIKKAFAIIEAAKVAGADAVKLQTYTADTMTIDHDGPGFRIESGLWGGRTLYELYQEAHTPWDWHPALFEKGRELGITVFSTPFDSTSVDLLEDLATPAYKIASFEAVDHALVELVAATGKPIIISTGMADKGEIADALEVALSSDAHEIALLHCVSGYPTPAVDYHLRTIPDLANWSEMIVGISDHTLGSAVAISAVALGACIVEKHVTLARADGGVDSTFSLEPGELAELVLGCRAAWEALGSANYKRKDSEKDNMIFRRSLYAVEDIAKGEKLTTDNVRAIRPGFGLAPRHLTEILGQVATRDLKRGEPLKWDILTK